MINSLNIIAVVQCGLTPLALAMFRRWNNSHHEKDSDEQQEKVLRSVKMHNSFNFLNKLIHNLAAYL